MTYKRSAKGDKLPGKEWRILAESADGVVVTLGKYDTKESAESDRARIAEEGFYRNLKITYSPPPAKPAEGEEVVVEPERRPARAHVEPDIVEAVVVDEEPVGVEEEELDGEVPE